MLRALIALLCLAAAATAARAPHPLPFFHDLYTFRGENGKTLVVGAFAVSAGDLRHEDVERGVRYRFDVTLVLADTADRSVFRRDDSVFVVLPRPLNSDHLLFTQLEIDAPVSSSIVQRAIMTDATRPGVGQMYSSPFTIRDYRGERLMLSDIALGQPDARSGWKRGDVTVALLPTSQFPSSAFEVYYEIYNLPRGAHYITEIVVAPDSGYSGDSRPVRLRFTDEARTRADGIVQELRRVDASIGKGRYRITATVTNERTGESASSSRVFIVQGWARGATLVPAMQRRGGVPD